MPDGNLDSIITKLRLLIFALKQILDKSIKPADVQEEDFDLELSKALVDECIGLIKEIEVKQASDLKFSKDQLRLFRFRIFEMRSFECPIGEVADFMKSYMRSRDGFGNKLPSLETDVRFAIKRLQVTANEILRSHKLPHTRKTSEAKQKETERLAKLLDGDNAKYQNFVCKLDNINVRVKRLMKQENERIRQFDEMKDYLSGDSDVFLSEDLSEEDQFMQDMFGGSSPALQELLRNSLKETMARRGMGPVEFLEKRKAIRRNQEHLEILYYTLRNFGESILFFEQCNVSKSLIKVHQYDMILHKLKNDINVAFKDDPPFPEADA